MNFLEFWENKKLVILIISISLNVLFGIFSGFMIYKYQTYQCPSSTTNKSLATAENTNVKEEIPTFFVEIKGAVKSPGVYEMNSNNIINDLIKVAGGFTKNAYTNNINLSRKVSNELVVYIYNKTEYKKTKIVEVVKPCECATYDIGNCTDNFSSEIIASDKDTVFDKNEPSKSDTNTETILININTTSANELIKLSGIGEAKANDIINYRTSNGNFKTIEDIKNVSGIGDALFAKIKDNITV